MTVKYYDGGKYAEFNGQIFCRDDHTGYYLNSTIGKRLHRVVYEYYCGEIPSGCEIHHIDHDKNNNGIENLVCVTKEEHKRIHAEEMTEEAREKLRRNVVANAVPAAAAWHGSAAGRLWHKRHYEKMKDAMHQKKKFVCAVCGKEYMAEMTGKNRYCSAKCKAKARRDSGVDNVEKECVICGKKYVANKYSRTRTCSPHCRNIFRWNKIRQEVGKTACL